MTADPLETQPRAAYTPEKLLEIAVAADVQYKSLAAEFGPGTWHEGRNAAREMRQSALACAAWMESHGHLQIANVGPFMTTSVHRGERVRIRRGSVIHGTGPGMPREGLRSGRAILVTAHSVDKGYVVDADRDNPSVVQGKVSWAGSGGYWRWTDINNVDPL